MPTFPKSWHLCDGALQLPAKRLGQDGLLHFTQQRSILILRFLHLSNLGFCLS